MADRRTYRVDVERDGEFLVLTFPDLPPGAVGQVVPDVEAEDVARDVLARWLEVPEDSFDVELVWPAPRHRKWSEIRRQKAPDDEGPPPTDPDDPVLHSV